ncbi:GNAT family N-acetyltransferase [Veronia nyctiphanis]|uniref:GNAT family N-acetyltransferase n=1 Tax=Veronia nyctiphanis TaxID=1278244 RepID=UPI0013762720|nr:GNAT family N-acetyltransferase [Veronia nyctiphanis]
MYQIDIIKPADIPMALLLEADPSESKIKQYLPKSRAWGVLQKEQLIAACLVVDRDSEREIINLAVSPDFQGQGIGGELLQHIVSDLLAERAGNIVLGTGAFGYQLAFYQQLGFRPVSVIRDFFIDNYEAPLFEDGVQHKDMIMMKYDDNCQLIVEGFKRCFSLRAGEEGDIPFLLALRKETMTRYLEEARMPVDDVSHLKRIRFHFDDVKIVEYEGQPVGLIKSVYTQKGKSRYWFLVQLQIAQTYQRQGIGEALLRHLIRQAEMNNEDIYLSVIRSNPARRFYERLGFVEYGHQGPEILLKKCCGKQLTSSRDNNE